MVSAVHNWAVYLKSYWIGAIKCETIPFSPLSIYYSWALDQSTASWSLVINLLVVDVIKHLDKNQSAFQEISKMYSSERNGRTRARSICLATIMGPKDFFHLEEMLFPKYLRIHFLLRLSLWSNFGHKYKQHNAWSRVISGKELSDWARRDHLTDNFV